MSWFQKLMNKHFGWEYAVFQSAMGFIEIKRFHRLSNGTMYLKDAFKRVMLLDGTLSVKPIFNCDPVKWEKL